MENNSMRLYDIAPELRDAIMSEEENAEDILSQLSIAFEKKAFGIVCVADELSGFVSMAKEEEKRIATKRKHVENKIDRLKKYLHDSMDVAEITEIKLGTKMVKLQKNPPKIVIDSEENIPAKFFIIKTTKNLDKILIKAEIKAGREVPGTHSEQGISLRIK